jgi:hypothetical protein
MTKLKFPALQLSILLSLCMQAEAKSYRDPAVRREFVREHPCPGIRERRCQYQVDHVIALECGGFDRLDNLAALLRATRDEAVEEAAAVCEQQGKECPTYSGVAIAHYVRRLKSTGPINKTDQRVAERRQGDRRKEQ